MSIFVQSLIYITSEFSTRLPEKWCQTSRTVYNTTSFRTLLCRSRRTMDFGLFGETGDTITVYPTKWNKWPNYSTLIYVNNQECMWPAIFSTTKRNSGLTSITTPVAVLGGFVDNFWHASVMLNKMCALKNTNVSFLVQSPHIPEFFYKWASNFGVNKTRVLHHTHPIRTQTPVTTLPFDARSANWECLREHMYQPFAPLDYILLVSRPPENAKNGRLFSGERVERVARELAKNIGCYIVHFNGSESFEVAREKFGKTRLIVSPHGAALVNIVFAHRDTHVVEILHKQSPWQMIGGSSMGLAWWPIEMKNFEINETRRLVNLVKMVYQNFRESSQRQVL